MSTNLNLANLWQFIVFEKLFGKFHNEKGLQSNIHQSCLTIYQVSSSLVDMNTNRNRHELIICIFDLYLDLYVLYFRRIQSFFRQMFRLLLSCYPIFDPFQSLEFSWLPSSLVRKLVVMHAIELIQLTSMVLCDKLRRLD